MPFLCETFPPLQMMKSEERLRMNTQGHLYKPTEYFKMIVCLHLKFNIYVVINSLFSLCCSDRVRVVS